MFHIRILLQTIFLLSLLISKSEATLVIYDDFSQPNADTGSHSPYSVYNTHIWDGAPGGVGLVPNNGTTPGNTVLGADLPGGRWQQGGSGWDYNAIEVGNLNGYGASSLKLTGGTSYIPYLNLHSTQNVAISLNGYTASALLAVSVDVCPQSNDCWVGFDSALQTATNFSGLRVDPSGGVSLIVNGSQVGGTIAFTGTFTNATARLLTFTVNTSTGAISNISLQGSTSSYNFTTSAFTPAATAYAALSVPSGSTGLFAYLQISSSPTVTSVPSPPASLTATAGNGQVVLNYAASTSATGYNIYRGTSPGGESATPIATGLSTLTYTDAGLSNGTTYYYTVAAVNSIGSSGYSTEVSAAPMPPPPPSAPATVTATAGNSQIVLNYSASAGATGYSIYRGTSSGGESATPIATGLSTLTYTDAGLSNGTTYYYKVTASNTSGPSGYSSEASATPIPPPPPSTPTGLTATAGNGQVSLNYTAATGATTYNIYRGTTSGGESTTAVATGVTALSYTDAGLNNNTTYYYKVTASNSSGSSGYSNEASATPVAVIVPTVVIYDDFSQPDYDTGNHTPYNVYNTQIWDAAPGGVGVLPNNGTTPGNTVLGADLPGGRWQQGGSGWDYNAIEVGNLNGYGASSLKLTGGTANICYLCLRSSENVAISLSGYTNNVLLTVSADVSPQGNDCWVGFDSALKTSTNFSGLQVDPSGGVSLIVNGSQVGSTIPFTGTFSNTTARLLTFTVNTSNGSISAISLQGSASTYAFTTSAFTPATTAFAALSVPVGGSAYFAYMQVASVPAVTAPPLPPASLTATAGNAQVALNYPASSTATSYNIYRGTSPGGESATPIATSVTGLTYTDIGLTNGTTYFYTVAALNSIGSSGYSTEASATPVPPPPPAPPTGLVAIAGNNQVVLNFNASAGATSYSIYRGTSPGGESTTPIASGVTTLTYTDSGATNGKTYYYTVTATGSYGSSGFSNEASAAPMPPPPPSAPTTLTATAGNGQVGLSYSASAGATSYSIYRGTSSGGESTTPIATEVTTLTYTDSGLSNGTTYYYKVTASNSSGSSGYSSEANATPAAPPPPSPPTGLSAIAGNGQVSLSYAASAGASSYSIYRATTPGGESAPAIATGVTTLSYTDTGVTNGIQYYYAVTASNSSGESGPSNEASATPVASNPAVLILYDDFSQPDADTGNHSPYNVYNTHIWDGAPGGLGLFPNNGTTPGNTILGADLPGGRWQQGGSGWDYNATEVGNLSGYGASSLKLTGGTQNISYVSLQSNENVAITLSGFNTNTQLNVSVDVSPQSGNCWVGFDSALGTANNFTGLSVDPSGGVSLIVNGSQVGSTIAFTGTFTKTTASLLTFTVNTATGAISNISLQGSASTYNFTTAAFTASATAYAALGTPPGGTGDFAYFQIISGSGGLSSLPTTAAPVSNFLNSIGVATHIAQGVDNPTNVTTCLTYAGIRNLRDDDSVLTSVIQSWIGIHNATGAKICVTPVNGDIPDSLTMYEQLAAGGALLAVEGPNEPNNFPVTYQGQTSSSTTALPTADFQRDLYNAVKADAKLAGIPVFASAEAGGSEPNNCGLQFLTIPSGAGTLMPDGTKYADYANTHNYVCGSSGLAIANNQAWYAEDPTLNSIWDGLYIEYGHTWWGPGYNGYSNSQLLTLPRVTTETGWVTQGTNAISEDQQGKLFLNLYLDAFKRSWSYTFIYYLHDSSQGDWGLFHSDYTAKLSATYLHNLTTILADSGSTTPGSVNYSIPGEPNTVHDLLLQKSNGTYYLAVWDERTVGSGSDSVFVNLGATYSSVTIYDPTVGTSATQTLSSANSVTLSLSDHPLILAIH
jgi:fibronectin type 3 domain-containing protein